MPTDFKLPELGENIETIQVVKVMVAVGDEVAVDQPVLELETDKATLEVPSSVEGKVTRIHVGEGDEMRVGDTVLSVEGGDGESDAAPAGTEPEAPAENPAPAEAPPEPPPAESVPESTPAPAPAAPAGIVPFILPELGENIETIQVVKVLAGVGDAVAIDQPVLELETDKATLEVPASVAGVVKEVHVREGDEISVGDTVLTLEGSAPAAASAAPAPAAPASAPPPTSPEASAEPEPEAETAAVPAAATAPSPPKKARRVPAAPSVRRFARELGIDVNEVSGSGPRGRVSVADVKAHAKQRLQSPAPAAPAATSGAVALPPLPDFEKWGAVQRDKMSVIRRKTAEQMTLSWQLVPHVTIFDSANITELEALRKRYKDRAAAAGGNLTMAVMVVKVVAQALRVFPRFNASLDLERREIVYKKYCNVGVAVSTERGLLVPVIRDADEKNMVQIAVEISEIAEKTRSGKISLDQLEGGTFTVTNLGRVSGIHFTPIINYPEVAILGIGRAYQKPADDGEGMDTILPLSLSFDHRIIDGADGAKFLAWIIEGIEQPLLLSLEG